MEDSTSASGSESVELNNSLQSDCCSASAVLSATDRKSIHAPTLIFICSESRRSTTNTLHPRYLITYSDTYIFLCSCTVPIRLCGAGIIIILTKLCTTEFESLNSLEREPRRSGSVEGLSRNIWTPEIFGPPE